MRMLRSIGWALMVVPALWLVTGCEGNESNISTKGSTTAPGATDSTDEMLKRGAEPAKRSSPSNYPGAGRRR
jgi:hypothetical protein